MSIPSRHRATWTPEEDLKLISSFSSRRTPPHVDDLANEFCRTKAAIASRLVRLGLLVEHRDAFHRIGPVWATWKDLRP